MIFGAGFFLTFVFVAATTEPNVLYCLNSRNTTRENNYEKNWDDGSSIAVLGQPGERRSAVG